jgi:hypothetical protein
MRGEPSRVCARNGQTAVDASFSCGLMRRIPSATGARRSASCRAAQRARPSNSTRCCPAVEADTGALSYLGIRPRTKIRPACSSVFFICRFVVDGIVGRIFVWHGLFLSTFGPMPIATGERNRTRRYQASFTERSGSVPTLKSWGM